MSDYGVRVTESRTDEVFLYSEKRQKALVKRADA